jgi:hypothetical protein
VDLESRLRLERDIPPVEEFLSSTGGAVHRRDQDPDGLYWVVLQPRNRERSPFTARVCWTVYPSRPPSLLFAPAIGQPTNVRSAWPDAPGYRAQQNDVCKPFTAEGQALHKAEWATGPHAWRGTGNPFLYVIETVQSDIDRVDGKRSA